MAEVIKTNNEEKATRLVFKAQIARQLLKMGNTIVDIKADKSDGKRTVFCFNNDKKFQNDFSYLCFGIVTLTIVPSSFLLSILIVYRSVSSFNKY